MTALRIGSLFSGYGGLDLASEAFFNATTAWHVEFDRAPSRILAARWPGVPNYGDVTAVKWTPDCPECGGGTTVQRRALGTFYHCGACGEDFPLSIRLADSDAERIPEPVDVLGGGFPCQDLSLAGRRAGMRPGTRSGLWSDFVQAIRALNPGVVVIENVRGLLSGCAESDLGSCAGCVGDGEHRPVLRALGRVLGDLASLGFDAEWGGVRASETGAPHSRFRVFVLAYQRDVIREWKPARLVGAPLDASGSLLPTPAAADGVGGRHNSPGHQETLPGTMLELFRAASEGALTLLPTPVTSDGTGGPRNDDTPNPHGFALQMRDIAPTLLPTTTAADASGSGGSSASNVTLTDAVTGRRGLVQGAADGLFPTPRASEGEKGGPNMRGSKGDLMLSSAVTRMDDAGLLPTPTVALADGGSTSRSGGRQDERLLGGIVQDATTSQGIAWGKYEPAVRRWEAITRPAPAPTKPDGKGGQHRLAPEFTEWMMGLPAGWVTDPDLGLSRREQLKACGNGVVPQQALAALSVLWDRAVHPWL